MNYMDEYKKTIFLDIDGCILKHQGNMSNILSNETKMLPGVKEKFSDWDKLGYKIILTTGRRESSREFTENQLRSVGLFWDVLIMGCNRGQRVIINDIKPNEDIPMAKAINLLRDEGLLSVNI